MSKQSLLLMAALVAFLFGAPLSAAERYSSCGPGLLQQTQTDSEEKKKEGEEEEEEEPDCE